MELHTKQLPPIKPQNHLTERFEVAFNQIHRVLKRINPYEQTDAFVKLLSVSSRKHAYMKPFYYDLKQFAKLRNALIHEKVRQQTYIATPHEDTVEAIEKIARIFTKPPTAMDIATRKVVSLDVSASLEAIIQTMNQSSYNQLPVYQNGAFLFLLTEGSLLAWMADRITACSIHLAGCTAADLRSYESRQNVRFVKKSMDIFALEDIFEESFQENQKLEAVILTENGQAKEQPLGIITPWDLIEIDLLQTGAVQDVN